MPTFSGSHWRTIPNTPPSFSELRPLNPVAHEAFDETVNAVIKHFDTYEHARQFLHADSRLTRAASVFTDDGTADDEHEPSRSTPQWFGGFKCSLRTAPQIPGEGWYLGTERGRPATGEVDILLAPQRSDGRRRASWGSMLVFTSTKSNVVSLLKLAIQ